MNNNDIPWNDNSRTNLEKMNLLKLWMVIFAILSFSKFLVNFFLFGTLEDTTAYLRNIDYAPPLPSLLTSTKHANPFLIAGRCESSNPSCMGLFTLVGRLSPSQLRRLTEM